MQMKIAHVQFIVILLFINGSFAQNTGQISYNDCNTNAGKMFLVSFADNGLKSIPLRLYMTSSVNETFNVRVETPLWNYTTKDVSVSYGNLTVVDLPTDLAIFGTTRSNQSVLVTADNYISLFASNMQRNRGDSYIIYPIESLGMEYIAVSSSATFSEYFSVFSLVAIEDETMIDISLPISVTCNGSIPKALNQYEVFQCAAEGNISGTYIKTNKPVAAFSGHQFTQPHISRKPSSDMIYSQLVPVIYWSTYYVTISNPIFDRGDGEIIRVFGFYDDSNVMIESYGGSTNITLSGNGSFYEFHLQLGENAVIKSDKPVLVSQESSAQPFVGGFTGDSRLVNPAPKDMWLDQYIFVTLGDEERSFYHGLVLISHSASYDKITLNSENLNSSLIWHQVQNTDMIYASFPLAKGHYILNCVSSSVKCWGYVFGIDSLEEYGTSIGQKFRPHNLQLLADEKSNEIQDTYFDFKDNARLLNYPPEHTRTTKSLLRCTTLCRKYTCGAIEYIKTDGTCNLYTEEAKCLSLQQSNNTRLYFVRN